MMCLARDRSDQFEEHLPGEEDYRVLPAAQGRHERPGGGRPGRWVAADLDGARRGVGRGAVGRAGSVAQAVRGADPAKVLLDLALTLALGGDTCSDLAVVRAEPAVFGPVASDPTASRTIARLAGDVEEVLPVIDRARAAARARVWAAAGTHAPDHEADARHPVVVDVDATLVTSHRRRTPGRRSR